MARLAIPRFTVRRLTVTDLARVAVFAALIVALAVPVSLHVFGSTVPFTLQTLGVMLAGLILGPVAGTLAVLVYLTLGSIGLPVFAGGAAGLGVFAGPTGGFLIAFPLGAFVVGLLALGPRTGNPVRPLVACLVGGVGVVYAIGIPWMAWRTGLSLTEAATVMAPFLAWDAGKAALATAIAVGVYKAYPPLAQRRTVIVDPTPVRP